MTEYSEILLKMCCIARGYLIRMYEMGVMVSEGRINDILACYADAEVEFQGLLLIFLIKNIAFDDYFR